MGKIVVIGGGELKDLETLVFDRRICELTGKKHPKALFIPTASGEPEGYVATFNNVYGKKLGCKTDVLCLIKEKPSNKEIKEKILGSDLIYVGGGNTLKMMNLWRKSGVDNCLRQAYRNGIVLSGLSAGGICWFEYGYSDSMSSYNPLSWKYIKVRGLGLIPGLHCPHASRPEKRDQFAEFIRRHSEVGIAIANHCAIEFIDGKYRVSSVKRNANAYVLHKCGKRVLIDELEKKKTFTPVSALYKK